MGISVSNALIWSGRELCRTNPHIGSVCSGLLPSEARSERALGVSQATVGSKDAGRRAGSRAARTARRRSEGDAHIGSKFGSQ